MLFVNSVCHITLFISEDHFSLYMLIVTTYMYYICDEICNSHFFHAECKRLWLLRIHIFVYCVYKYV
jgi:hypothetical protein